MNRKYMWLVLALFSFIVLLLSVYKSYRSGEPEYAWIIGSLLFGIGCGGTYYKMRKPER